MIRKSTLICIALVALQISMVIGHPSGNDIEDNTIPGNTEDSNVSKNVSIDGKSTNTQASGRAMPPNNITTQEKIGTTAAPGTSDQDLRKEEKLQKNDSSIAATSLETGKGNTIDVKTGQSISIDENAKTAQVSETTMSSIITPTTQEKIENTMTTKASETTAQDLSNKEELQKNETPFFARWGKAIMDELFGQPKIIETPNTEVPSNSQSSSEPETSQAKSSPTVEEITDEISSARTNYSTTTTISPIITDGTSTATTNSPTTTKETSTGTTDSSTKTKETNPPKASGTRTEVFGIFGITIFALLMSVFH